MSLASLWKIRADDRSGVLTQVAKTALACTLHQTGALTLSRKIGAWYRGPMVIFVAYHRIVRDLADASQTSRPSQLTSARTFERQLGWIAEHFDVVSLDRALDVLQGGVRLRRDAAVVTIDDGYRETYDVAFGILRRLVCPATVYVPTALIGADEPILDDVLHVLVRDALGTPSVLRASMEEAGIAPPTETAGTSSPDKGHGLAYALLNTTPHAQLERLCDSLARRLPRSYAMASNVRLMTWPMLREMQQHGVTIGSHTRMHRRLPLLPPDEVWQEIAGSKAELEERLQTPARHFAYPDGRRTPLIESAVARAGYVSAAGSDEVANTSGCDPYALGRQVFWEHASEWWPSRHSRAMTIAQASGALPAMRRALHIRTRA